MEAVNDYFGALLTGLTDVLPLSEHGSDAFVALLLGIAIGFVVGILFLELNGYRFAATQENAAQAVIALAAGTLDEAGYTSFLRANTEVQREKQ